jgi:L-aspartate oxidase
VRTATQQAMSLGAGVLRSDSSLAATAATLEALAARRDAQPRAEAWEATNLHQVATALTAAAARRQETRGSHWREDFPATDDERWRVRQVVRATAAGPDPAARDSAAPARPAPGRPALAFTEQPVPVPSTEIIPTETAP